MSTGPAAVPSLPRELADLAMVLVDLIRQEFKESATAAGPTFSQFKLLHAIRKGVRRMGKLAERFGISQPATSMAVEAMVKAGLVARRPDPRDRRQIELHLTPKATARLEATYQRAFAKMEKRLTGYTAGEKKALAKEIRELTRLLSTVDR